MDQPVNESDDIVASKWLNMQLQASVQTTMLRNVKHVLLHSDCVVSKLFCKEPREQ